MQCNKYLLLAYLSGDACNQWNFPTGGPTNPPTDNIECFACGYKVTSACFYCLSAYTFLVLYYTIWFALTTYIKENFYNNAP